MTAPYDAEEDRSIALHDLLLRLAGKVSDDLIVQARAWVAEGEEGQAARALTSVVHTQNIALIDDDIALLGEVLIDEGSDTSILAQVQVAQYDPTPPFRFASTGPGVDPPVRQDDAPLDEIDREAVAAAAEEETFTGMWRAWRYPGDASPWPPPRRIYIVEADEDAELVDLTAWLQERLAEAGETDPQVEMYQIGTELPTYQRLAKAYGSLIWASTPAPQIKMATVFDGVDAVAGPTFSDDHERLDEGTDAAQVIAYLQAGEPLMVTTAQMDDVVDRSRRNSVPMNFRTDGTWIWTDTTTYYLAQHQLTPDPELLEHIRSVGYEMPALDGVALHRAMAALQEPSDEEPVWTHGG